MSKINNDSLSLFLVTLGGRVKGSHVEQHDLRWVVGNKIEDTFHQLRKQWIGMPSGLHIDSYIRIDYIDGFQIKLSGIQSSPKKTSSETTLNSSKQQRKLWFINLGGYHPSYLFEQHQYSLVVANSSTEAKKLAKSRWRSSLLKIHKDNEYKLNYLLAIDNSYSLDFCNGYFIDLVKDPLSRSQLMKPDWYGYKRIDYSHQYEIKVT